LLGSDLAAFKAARAKLCFPERQQARSHPAALTGRQHAKRPQARRARGAEPSPELCDRKAVEIGHEHQPAPLGLRYERLFDDGAVGREGAIPFQFSDVVRNAKAKPADALLT
jgi:hypothetical protein